MASNSMFGWDLTFKSIEGNITQKSDVLIAFVHWLLIKRGFRVIDTSEDLTFTGDEKTFETLPNDWNTKDKYSLRYLYEKKLYVLLGIHSENNLIINLMRATDLSVSNFAINVNDTVQAISGSIEELIPTYNDVKYKIERDLINSTCEKSSGSSEVQTDPPVADQPSLMYNPRRSNPQGFPFPDRDIAEVGRADLDPFGRGGGGMLYHPFGPNINNPGVGAIGGLPRGAVPPGARFDPFGPPQPQPPGHRRPPPDADHFPPPGYDNFYM